MTQKNLVIFFIGILIISSACIIGAVNSALDNVYAVTAIVVDINYIDDVITVEDCNGNLWSFEGSEDWERGDCASLVINDRGTAKIFDDVVESVRYNSWNLSR